MGVVFPSPLPYHRIWKNTYGNLIDITPFDDGREYNIFSTLDTKEYYSGVVYTGKEYKLLEPGINILQ